MATKRTATLTRQGALAVTTDMDKLATLFQHNAEILGVPAHIASDFAYRLDLLSDHVEQHAIRMAAEAGEEVEPEAESADKKAAESEPEADKAEEPKADADKTAAAKKADFDAGSIAKTVAGPLEELPPKEPAITGHFKQDKFHELHDKQVGGGLGKSAKVAAFDLLASAFRSVFAGEDEDAETPAEEKAEQAKEAAVVTAGCEKLPEGGMRDNCEAKKKDGEDKPKDDKKDDKPDFDKMAGYNLFGK